MEYDPHHQTGRSSPECREGERSFTASLEASSRRRRNRRPKSAVLRVLRLIVILTFLIFLLGQSIVCLCAWSRTASTKYGWNLILVNPDYRIPKNWEIELTQLSNGQQVDQRIYPQLQQMFDDARSQGVYPVVASGYRTPEKQQALMDEKIQQLIQQGYSQASARKEAGRWVAKVGYSEHQTGLAVDINADGVNSSAEDVYAWLAEHAWEYGFIQRYPEDKEALTGTAYEPWHYRYVGNEAAAAMYNQDICLEEYVALLG